MAGLRQTEPNDAVAGAAHDADSVVDLCPLLIGELVDLGLDARDQPPDSGDLLTLRDAITNNDMDGLHDLFDDSFTIRYNTNPEAIDKAMAINNISSLRGAVPKVAYHNVRIHEIDNGFVQEATLHVTTDNGATLAVDLCMVAELGNSGKIVEINEYMDSAQMNVPVAQ